MDGSEPTVSGSKAVATFKMLNPYIRQTAKQWPIPGPISRKTSTDKVHAIAHRPRCNLQDG